MSHCDRPEENTGSQNKSGALGLERRMQIQQMGRGQDLVKMKLFVSWKTCLTVFLLIPECHVFSSSRPPVLVILGSHSHSLEPSIGPCSRGVLLSGVTVHAWIQLPCRMSSVLSLGNSPLAFLPSSWSPGHEQSELTIPNLPASDFKGRSNHICVVILCEDWVSRRVWLWVHQVRSFSDLFPSLNLETYIIIVFFSYVSWL